MRLRVCILPAVSARRWAEPALPAFTKGNLRKPYSKVGLPSCAERIPDLIHYVNQSTTLENEALVIEVRVVELAISPHR
jgi:hypothetical protein